MRCALPYCETFQLTSGSVLSTTGTAVQFVPNSLYAPLASGHQPYTFDQLCSATGPYTKYKVLGFKCRLTFTNINAGNNQYGLQAVVRLVNITDNYSITGKLTEEILEKPTSKWGVVPATGNQSWSTTVDVPDLSVLFNWSKEQYTADTFASVGTYGAAPASLVGLHVALANPASVGQLQVNCIAEFLFDTVFTERQTLAQS
jgi:hypothetical protein